MSSEANKPEPFGYFRAMPFGWEDCAATDDGARALYDEDAIRTQAARIAELEAEVERLRKPLTDEQIMAAEESSYVAARRPVRSKDHWGDEVTTWEPTKHFNYFMFARAIEAAKEGK